MEIKQLERANTIRKRITDIESFFGNFSDEKFKLSVSVSKYFSEYNEEIKRTLYFGKNNTEMREVVKSCLEKELSRLKEEFKEL